MARSLGVLDVGVPAGGLLIRLRLMGDPARRTLDCRGLCEGHGRRHQAAQQHATACQCTAALLVAPPPPIGPVEDQQQMNVGFSRQWPRAPMRALPQAKGGRRVWFLAAAKGLHAVFRAAAAAAQPPLEPCVCVHVHLRACVRAARGPSPVRSASHVRQLRPAGPQPSAPDLDLIGTQAFAGRRRRLLQRDGRRHQPRRLQSQDRKSVV